MQIHAHYDLFGLPQEAVFTLGHLDTVDYKSWLQQVITGDNGEMSDTTIHQLRVNGMVVLQVPSDAFRVYGQLGKIMVKLSFPLTWSTATLTPPQTPADSPDARPDRALAPSPAAR